VAGLAGVLRQLLLSVTNSAAGPPGSPCSAHSCSSPCGSPAARGHHQQQPWQQWQQQQQSATPPLLLPGSPSRTGQPAISVLSQLVDCVGAELTWLLRGAGQAGAAAAQLEAQLASRSEELAALQGTLR
jgi:hypothetical protein